MGILDLVAGPILDIVNKIIPTPMTPEQKAEAALAIAQLNQQTQFKELDAQIAEIQSQTDTNKVEAANTSIFVSGWRPFIGWICGTGLGWNYIGISVLSFITTAIGHPIVVAKADLSEMMPLLIGMLGLGGMRTFEKINGVNSGN